MREIQLTQNQVAQIDDEDFEWLSEWKWYAWRRSEIYGWYAIRSDKIDGQPVQVRMHVAIWERHNEQSVLEGNVVDHHNGNSLDNQQSNLRQASFVQNRQNSRMRSDNSSGFKGVSLVSGKEKFRAYISPPNTKPIHLGTFDSILEAAEAYNTAAIEIHGEFARLNEIR